jgi:hypothetical protein
MVLRCVSRYRSSAGEFEPSDEPIHVADELGALLLRDSPGSFVLVQTVIEGAPDRQQRGGMRR